MRALVLLTLALCTAPISIYSVNTPPTEAVLQQVKAIDDQIKELEDQKRAYDREANLIGRAADRLQFEDFLLARRMYSNQRRIEYKAEALQDKINELKKKRVGLLAPKN